MTAIEFNHKLVNLQPNLSYFATMLTSNHEEANDLVQDTFLKAIVNKEKFRPNTNLKAWTYTIMKNTFINNYRRRIKSNTIIDTTEDLYYLNNSRRSGEESPESKISVKEIIKSIEKLEAEHRKPFEMHFQGYKYKEIADLLDLSIGTVKSRIFFTRKKLMKSLKEYRNN
jgi:RNA polymerase sigma-70 factor (ECF subfamily)